MCVFVHKHLPIDVHFVLSIVSLCAYIQSLSIINMEEQSKTAINSGEMKMWSLSCLFWWSGSEDDRPNSNTGAPSSHCLFIIGRHAHTQFNCLYF